MSTKADWLAANAAVEAISDERYELLKPTDDKMIEAMNRLEQVEADCVDLLGRCDGCTKPIWEGDKSYSYDDGPMMCEACAPTYGEMLADQEGWFTYGEDGDPVAMTAEKAKEICDQHIAAGGALTDSMAEA